MRRANLLVFLGAGTGLAACDRMHVRAGVLTQRGGGWWVAPMFGCAGLVIARAARPFVREPRGVVREAPPFVAAYAATALAGTQHPRLLAAALWATGLPRVRGDLRFALLLAAAGPAAEAAVARTGAFAYARPLHEVLPWLAGLYVHGAPLALATAAAAAAEA